MTNAFVNYVKVYDLSNPNINLKYIHTGKVAQNCEKIAMSLELPGEDVEIAWEIGMLHDIGRWKQYLDGTPHEKASAFLSPEILIQSGFDEEETNVIVAAIESHRDQGIREERSLKGLLYRADKDSRPCFACKAEKECNWKNERKNLLLKV